MPTPAAAPEDHAALAARRPGFARPGEEQRQPFAVIIEKLVSEAWLPEKNGLLATSQPPHPTW